jgi:6-pyruvoyltetrahydropterin/6-carboxytetrahydropterin synthase
MIRLSQRFEFSAAHRLHNPDLDDATNVATFGKCNNPLGHGHNYELQVTVLGEANRDGVLIRMSELEKAVEKNVIDKLDHKNLNVEVPEFKTLNPSVENIAKVIYGMLKAPLEKGNRKLASVTVWETPRTWCEYSE